MEPRMYSRYFKHFFDLAIGLIGVCLCALPMAVIALLIRTSSKGSVIFSQLRVGKGGKTFRIYKFKTMEDPISPISSITVAGDKRITHLGLVLRRWKLDEIPQLWNIVKGEMSLVGPRPDVTGYADRLAGSDQRILRLRPGITGPASLKYADEESLLATVEDPKTYNDNVIYPDKLKINLEYLDHCTFSKDLFYLWKTVSRLFKS